ncbi:isocitrate lyase/phosphoenolpyruvate mutase family protein [Streptomyces sp. NPDC058855]|uniref:isocitrate lyase/PEP mutase family protein n=1 Tax=Streptomyces sp. NPDC058855 TaxID=3346651 RepID=UPI00368BBE4B
MTPPGVTGTGTRAGAAERARLLRDLHRGRRAHDPLVLPGPWDAASARAFEAAGFPALATPSAGIAASLGYEDGATPPGEMFAAVARIVRSVSVPVTADLEGGYGLPPAELVERIRESGAVGVNLEDTDRATGGLKDAGAHAEWLARVRDAAGPELFVNARVDAYLRGGPDPAGEALTRARLYAAAGADCVYPIGAPPSDLPALRSVLGNLSLNALAVPGGPPFAELGRLGADRLTFGNALLLRAVGGLANLAAELRAGHLTG